MSYPRTARTIVLRSGRLLLALALIAGLALAFGGPQVALAQDPPLSLSVESPSAVDGETDIPLAVDTPDPQNAFALESWGAGNQLYRTAVRLENPDDDGGTVEDIRVKFTVAGGSCGTEPIIFEYWNMYNDANTWASFEKGCSAYFSHVKPTFRTLRTE